MKHRMFGTELCTCLWVWCQISVSILILKLEYPNPATTTIVQRAPQQFLSNLTQTWTESGQSCLSCWSPCRAWPAVPCPLPAVFLQAQARRSVVTRPSRTSAVTRCVPGVRGTCVAASTAGEAGQRRRVWSIVDNLGTGPVLTDWCAQTATGARDAPSVPSSAGRTRTVFIDLLIRITPVKSLPHYFSNGLTVNIHINSDKYIYFYIS